MSGLRGQTRFMKVGGILSVRPCNGAIRWHNRRSEPPVTHPRSREVRELFEAALEARPDDCLACLRQMCHGDDQLYAQVEGLLLADGLADKGLTLTPHVLSILSGAPPDLPRLEGRRVGQYRSRS